MIGMLSPPVPRVWLFILTEVKGTPLGSHSDNVFVNSVMDCHNYTTLNQLHNLCNAERFHSTVTQNIIFEISGEVVLVCIII